MERSERMLFQFVACLIALLVSRGAPDRLSNILHRNDKGHSTFSFSFLWSE